CHSRRARRAGRRPDPALRRVRHSAGAGDCALARQARRRSRGRRARAARLADAGMGTAGAEIFNACPPVTSRSGPLSLLWASVAASLIALAGCAYLIAAALLVGRFMRQDPRTSPDAAPSVTILKPLHGDEPGLLDNLASFCAQDYPGGVQMVCG